MPADVVRGPAPECHPMTPPDEDEEPAANLAREIIRLARSDRPPAYLFAGVVTAIRDAIQAAEAEAEARQRERCLAIATEVTDRERATIGRQWTGCQEITRRIGEDTP